MHKFFSMLICCLLLLAGVVFFNGCAKDYSYEGGPQNGGVNGTAVYTLSGAGATCTGSLLTGDYYAGNPLTAGNTVVLKVDVTTIGTYTVSTSLVDGFRFSGSGTFVNTGIQTITLTGSGTPAAIGSFNVTIPVGAGCSFTVTVTSKPIQMGTFRLAGGPNDCENAGAYGAYVAGVKMNVSNYAEINVNVTTVGAYTLSTDTLDGISFSTSGTFTKTGDQTIKLPASGTPESPRNLRFTPATGTSQCGFEVTVINAEPLATYVLESGSGSPNPCIYTVAGNYVPNTPLSNANTVSIRVYVTVVGNFTIATNTVNGMTFSFTGNFATTGATDVFLTGSGTPAIPGSFTFSPRIVGPHPLGGSGCAFVITIP